MQRPCVEDDTKYFEVSRAGEHHRSSFVSNTTLGTTRILLHASKLNVHALSFDFLPSSELSALHSKCIYSTCSKG